MNQETRIVNALVLSCIEFLKAMRDYEMDVDNTQPHKHRAMMKRAQDAIEAAQKGLLDELTTKEEQKND